MRHKGWGGQLSNRTRLTREGRREVSSYDEETGSGLGAVGVRTCTFFQDFFHKLDCWLSPGSKLGEKKTHVRSSNEHLLIKLLNSSPLFLSPWLLTSLPGQNPRELSRILLTYLLKKHNKFSNLRPISFVRISHWKKDSTFVSIFLVLFLLLLFSTCFYILLILVFF